MSITQEWNAWQGDTVCEAVSSTWPPITHRSPHHLKARTEDVGNSGPLACHICTSAQDTILFIWFAFRLCPLTSGYSKLEDTSQPRQSLSSVKSKSFIWAQPGWRKKTLILCSACPFCSSPPSELRGNETAEFEWSSLQGVLFIPASISICNVDKGKMTKPSAHSDPKASK